MADSFYIGIYWGSRPEPFGEITNKVIQTLKKLGELDEQFLNWYEQGMSRKKALEKKFSLDAENIKKLCLERVKTGELNEKGYASNGFIFGLWTGHKEENSSSISFIVGGAFNTDKLKNSCVLKIPYEGGARERLLNYNKAREIIAELIKIWNADYAVLTSHELSNKLKVVNEIGWITYRKLLRRSPKISNKVVYENNDGHWFYLRSENYDYGVVNELSPIKEV
jgi:hypothetical protein